ncbi:putative cyclic nucleotide-gated ion channel 20,chloroplastic [Trichinella pseudospiralis]
MFKSKAFGLSIMILKRFIFLLIVFFGSSKKLVGACKVKLPGRCIAILKGNRCRLQLTMKLNIHLKIRLIARKKTKYAATGHPKRIAFYHLLGLY